MSVADYTSKIKDICDSLASIDVNVEEGEMVQISLGGLTSDKVDLGRLVFYFMFMNWSSSAPT